MPEEQSPHPITTKKNQNWFMRHKVLSIIGTVILIAIVASAVSGGDAGNTSNSTDQSNATSSSSKPKETTAKIGQPANDGKFQFTVNSVKCGETTIGDQYINETAQGQFCRLSLTVKNIGDQAQSLISSDQHLLNASGQKYDADDTATLYAEPSGTGASSTWYNDINPGNGVTGDIIFDIPKGQKPVTAELHDSSFSNGVKVNLQ